MNIFIVSSLLAFVACELLAAFVYLKDRKSSINRSFVYETFLIGIWALYPFLTSLFITKEEALLVTKIVYWAAIMVPPAFLYFVYNLIGGYETKKDKRILSGFYILSCLFLIFSLNPLFIKDIYMLGDVYAIVPGMLYHLFFLYFSVTIIFGYVKIYFAYKKAMAYKKNQFRYVLIAFVIAGAGGLIHFLSAYGVKEIFPHDILVVLFTAMITYSIVKYRSININIVIKRTAVYSLSAGLLTGLFVVLVITITDLLSTFSNVSSFKISIFAALIIALLFTPLRNRIQNIIDSLFYKKTYDYYSTVKKVSTSLVSMFDLQNIFKFIGDTIYDVMGLQSIHVLAAGQGSGYEVAYHLSRKNKSNNRKLSQENEESNMKISQRSGIVKFCKKSGDIVVLEELLSDDGRQGDDLADKIKMDLSSFQGEAAVPVFVDGKLTLLIILGHKLSGDMFTQEDIDLLGTLSDQTAIAVKNAGLYKDKVNSARLASIGMMSATFAHEIRNPLTSLKTFAQLMPEKYNDEEFRNTFSKIVVSEIERINSLIGDLLDFSSEEETGRTTEIDIKEFIDDVLDYIKGRLELGSQNIVIEKVYNNVKINLYGDVEKLKQAFINIVNNGCQAMCGDGVLKVDIKPNARHVDISIADTGEGIKPDDISKIFDPFVTSKEMGVGLGLAISKRIIEDHKGKIKVKSSLSKGTTFTISLPMYDS